MIQQFELGLFYSMYKISLPQEIMKDLWRLREFCGEGPIIQQIKNSVRAHIQNKEREIGCPIADVQEAREKHEQKSN